MGGGEVEVLPKHAYNFVEGEIQSTLITLQCGGVGVFEGTGPPEKVTISITFGRFSKL